MMGPCNDGATVAQPLRAYAQMVAYSKCMSECGLLCLPCPKVSLMTHLAGNYLNAGIKAERWGTGHQSIVPYQV